MPTATNHDRPNPFNLSPARILPYASSDLRHHPCTVDAQNGLIQLQVQQLQLAVQKVDIPWLHGFAQIVPLNRQALTDGVL